MQDSLSKRITNKTPLTEAEIDAMVALFGARCKPRTKYQIRLACLSVDENLRNRGIYERVLFNDHGQVVSYCAGQSYPDEIKSVRECLVER